MVNGLDKFKERFRNFSDAYMVIGGTACSILIDDAGFEFRPTSDIDMILIVDGERFDEFSDELLNFIEDGDYSCEERSNGTKKLYRFKEPKNFSFPNMIELFSRNVLKMKGKRRITYVPTDKNPSGLSAMLLDDAHYKFALNGRIYIDDVWTLDAAHLIPLKIFAWLNFHSKKTKDVSEGQVDTLKHKLDVFRLLPLVAEDLKVESSNEIKNEITQFIDLMETESLNVREIFLDLNSNIALQERFDKSKELEKLKKIYL